MKHYYLLGCLLLLALGSRAQNVGIGTTSPTQTLDVNGTLRVRAAAGTGPGRLLGVAAAGTLQAQSAPFGATAAATPQPPVSLGLPVATGNYPDGVAVNPAGTRAYVVDGYDSTLQTFVIGSSRLVAVGADGSLGSVDPVTLPGDNLGNHTATQQLNLSGNLLANVAAVRTPTTGTSNMVAVAYGSIGSNSTTPYASSGNFGVANTAGSGVYTLTFTSPNLAGINLDNSAVLVSLYGRGPALGFINWEGGVGTVTIYTAATSGAAADRGFTFSVFLH